MKNNKGMTLIELIVSMVLLSIILLFLRTLVSNLAFNEVDKEYDDNVMRDLLVDNIQDNLIHFGLAYVDQPEGAVARENQENDVTVKINTLGGTAILLARYIDNQYEIIYNDVYGKNATWTLSEELTADLDNISVDLGNNNDKGNVFFNITIPIYEVDKEDKDNNSTYNDFIINYYGRNNKNDGTYIEPETDEEEDEEKEKEEQTPTNLASYLIKYADLWQSGLEGDGYRYIGSGKVGESTNPNNFICFGTNDKAECTESQSKYMYRIIGVFNDANNNKHVKLIMYKQLANYSWYSSNSDINWESTPIYSGLNGSDFLTNTTYDYMQNTTWLNKISDWTWSVVKTRTWDGYGGPNYYYITTRLMYLHELNRNTKSSSVGIWTTPSSKIGLMYASDYALSLGSSSLNLTSSSNKSTLQTGWMNPINNDTSKDSWEWTLSRLGYDNGNYETWGVCSDGGVGVAEVLENYATRPVFYLDSKVTRSSGTGTLTDPYMITP
jgi:prepilin-type N-terminal cleavage/methylation domain-containing protein